MGTSYDIEAVRQRAREHYNGADGFENAKRKNAYQCDDCASFIVTVDREPGVTPFMVGCGNCDAMAKSKFYRVAGWMEPTHEWYRPDTLDGLSEWSAEHVKKGGLMLRQIGGGDAKAGWQSPEDGLSSAFETVKSQRLAELQRELAEIDAQKEAILRKLAEPSPIKREDYPSRQAYRHAQTQHRKGRLT
ncbi:hypothetical protein [Aurantiacibacter zhengii]|uniref:Uncharacterized protein n=1 Tax=Aurantiacibacter zhengii TaxID=2307003 RepID=A0A418NTJ8_9SPHN|nr:hypothetical protein [Aurantiacibacter zhengii]RIV87472.1 hypothetical protein D2V07_03740 [Aurantiacibacter zhengii]